MDELNDIYPMPAFPMLAVSDLAASAGWYQEVLGFHSVFTMAGPGDQPILAHLRWARYADLLLTGGGRSIAGAKGAGVTLNFAMFAANRTVDELAEHARARGAQIASGPADQPWNTREVTILDPDGYRLTFTEPRDIQMAFDQVLENIKKAVE